MVLQHTFNHREWATNIHRDSYASHLGHYSRIAYMAAAENTPIAEMRYNFLSVSCLYERIIDIENDTAMWQASRQEEGRN